MSRKGPRYFHAIEVIRRYPENAVMYDAYKTRQSDILHSTRPAPEVRISGKGTPGNPTESKGMALADEARIKFLEQTTLAVRYAIQDYGDTGDEKKNKTNQSILRIIELCDFKRTHTVLGAAAELNYSERQTRRLRAAFIYRVMDRLGW